MNDRKNSAISFGITLTSAGRTANTNRIQNKRGSAIRRENADPVKIGQISLHEFECPRTKIPPPNKPFTPDLFNCEPVPLPTFPPPRKMSPKEERVQKELERFRSRTTSQSSSGKSSSSVASAAWEIFKILCLGLFIVLKYAVIAICLIITIGCFICAGRQTREVYSRW